MLCYRQEPPTRIAAKTSTTPCWVTGYSWSFILVSAILTCRSASVLRTFLVSMIDHDPHMIRHTLFRQIMGKQPPLTDTLIDLLLVEVDLGVKSQISDALKVLLDTVHPIFSKIAS